ADFDNDGDQDIFMEMGGALPGDVFSNLLFENPGTPNRWTRISLRGKQANYFGVGARIRIQTLQQDGSTATSHHLVSTGGAFGANPISLQAGLGSAVRIVELAVNWPSQSPTQIFRDLPTDCELLLTEGSPDVVQRMIKPGISAKNSR
ncbi:MAG: ASPIC/UnbV domain-containing protein, partial [Planctomycetaceae bacterium]